MRPCLSPATGKQLVHRSYMSGVYMWGPSVTHSTPNPPLPKPSPAATLTLKEKLSQRASKALDRSSSYLSPNSSASFPSPPHLPPPPPPSSRKLSSPSVTTMSSFQSAPSMNKASPPTPPQRKFLHTTSSSSFLETSSSTSCKQERCSCLPGWAVLRELPNGMRKIHVEVHGYAYSPRKLSEASRSQRMFFKIAKQVASLPNSNRSDSSNSNNSNSNLPIEDYLDSTSATTPPISHSKVSNISSDDEFQQNSSLLLSSHLMDEPLPIDQQNSIARDLKDSHNPISRSGDQAYEKITAYSETAQIPSGLVSNSSVKKKRSSSLRVPLPAPPKHPALKALKPKPPVPPKHPSLKGIKLSSSPSILKSENVSSLSPSISSADNVVAMERKKSGESVSKVTRMHSNFDERLRNFFSNKLEGRKVHVQIFDGSGEDKHFRGDRGLITSYVVTTGMGGIFSSEIMIPWPKDDLPLSLRVQADLIPSESATTLSPHQVHPLPAKRRVTSTSDNNNLAASAENSTASSTAPLQSTLTNGLRFPTQSVTMSMSLPGVPRILSDIDDTIKHTDVPGGIRAVLRNVFSAGHAESKIYGMAEWYRAMHNQGAAFHYVSNAPMELCETLKEYLHSGGFPKGSLRLKKYTPGNNFFAGLLESPADRKRPGVEQILNAFPDSQFILIGDSGEQDLQLYSEIAHRYPHLVKAIFIRDVFALEINPPVLPEPDHPEIIRASSAPGNSNIKAAPTSPLSEKMTTISEVDRKGNDECINDGNDGDTAVPVMKRRSSLYRANSMFNPAATRTRGRTKSSALISTPSKPNVRGQTYPYPEVSTPPSSSTNAVTGNSSTTSSTSTSPTSSIHYCETQSQSTILTEARKKLSDAFYARAAEVERNLPPGIVFRIFRNGTECVDDSITLIKLMAAGTL